MKRVHTALTEKNKEAAALALKVAVKALDKASTKGAMHPKAVSRTISRLSAQVHKLSIAVPVAAPSKPVKAGKGKAGPKAAAAPKADKKAPAKK
ncbi:hypothetical protein BH09MYX1_BH09MYX1_61280 [soil metagenome]